MLCGALREDYERRRRRQMAAYRQRMDEAIEQLTWPLARRHAHRDEALRALVRTARERSPWHARRLRHVDPRRLTGEGLAAIPPMTKDDLMTNWDGVVTDRRVTLALASAHAARVAEHGPAYLLDSHHVVVSGGSSGVRGVFAWDFDGWIAVRLMGNRAVAWLQRHLGWPTPGRWATVGAADQSHMTAASYTTFTDPAARGLVLSCTRPLAEIVDALNACRPDYLVAYPSILHLLAVEHVAGRLRIGPAALLCTGEPVLPEARDAIERAFRVPIMDLYGASEAGTIAHSFPGVEGLFLVEETLFLEPVDEHGRPVPPGVPARRVLLTNLANHLLPLIRYEVTDEVRFLPDPGPAPWTARRIAGIRGRSEDVFAYADGVRAHPHVFEAALTRVAAVAEYQVRQTRRGADVLVRAEGPLDLARLARDLAEGLARLGLPDPEVRVTAVPDLRRLGHSAKLQRFVPLPPR
jgi:phenylacetate-CoA ligase